jgi:hypothetical protein
MKQYLIKTIRKELSKLKNKNGIKLSQILQNLPTELQFSEDIIIPLTKNDKFIKIDSSKQNTIILNSEFYENPEYFQYEDEIYNYRYIKNLFKEDVNTNILLIYKLIIDSEELNYIEISKLLDSLCKIKLDIKQVAHYCKELKLLNLVKIDLNSVNNNERIITKKNLSYDKIDPELTASESQDVGSRKAFTFNQCPNNILQIDEAETEFIKTTEFIDKHYIDNRFGFIVDENSIHNNILFHLMLSGENKGLTLNEISLLLGMVGREKCIGRIVSNMTKEGIIVNKSIREGKVFEYRYFIKPETVPTRNVDFYVKYFKGLNNVAIFPDKTRNLRNNNIEIVKQEVKEDNSNVVKNKKFTNDFIELNDQDFNFIVNIISKNLNDAYSALLKKYSLPSFDEIYIRENKFNILLDFFNSISSITANKSFSDISFNRYLFCLNTIRDKEILSSVDLKHLIVEKLEKNKAVIDRKTLKKILQNLEKLGLIKILEYEITMKNKEYNYVKNAEIKQIKFFVLSREIEITPHLTERIETDIKANKPKKPNAPVKKEEFEEHNELIKTSSLKIITDDEFEELKISKDENFYRKFVQVLNKNAEKYESDNKMNVIKLFFENLKKIKFIGDNLKEIFNKADENFNSEIYLQDIIENKKLPKVILPSYMKKKLLVKNNNVINNISYNKGTIDSLIEQDDNMDICEEGSYEKSLYKSKSFTINNIININETIKTWSKNGHNTPNLEDIDIAKSLFKVNEKDKHLNPVKKINEDSAIYEELIMLKKKRNKTQQRLDKKADFLNILSKIYFTPKINIKKLRHSFHLNHESCIDFLMYLRKHGLLKVDKNNGEISFQLDDSIKNYIKFN